MGLNNELGGMLVVSIEQAVAAPYCGLLLADAGARLIKVERPDGDFARRYDDAINGQSGIFAWLNRGKESVCIDLEQPVDVALLRAMLIQADVFVHNLAPGSLDRRGFDGATLREHNPALIVCQITGYGAHGAAANKKAYDFLVQAETGLCSVTGTADEPARVGISVADLSTGLTAFSAILRALIQRSRTQTGIDLTVSMFDVMADWMNMALISQRYLGHPPARLGLRHALVAPYGAYKTGDGGQILIAVQNNREWQAFCDQVLGQPMLGTDARFANNPERVANRAALDAAIDAVFGRETRARLIAAMDTARIACAPLNSVEDLSSHHLLRNIPVDFAETVLSVADLPIHSDAGRAREVPDLDQHGAQIRQEFGG